MREVVAIDSNIIKWSCVAHIKGEACSNSNGIFFATSVADSLAVLHIKSVCVIVLDLRRSYAVTVIACRSSLD